MTVQWSLTIDCRHPSAQAEFWAVALGYRPASPPKGFASWEEWFVRRVPEEEWDHPDLQVGGGRAEPQEVRWARVTEAVGRLVAAGATVLCESTLDDGTPDHVVMADPEGNEFCVV